MRHDGAGADDCTVPDVHTVENDTVRANPDIIVDLYTLHGQSLAANRYIKTFEPVICGDDYGMSRNADIITNVHATVSVHDGKRVETAVAPDPDVSAIRVQHTEVLNTRVVPNDEGIFFRTSRYAAEITNRNVAA
jgi:hypothetical protein